MQTYYLIKRTKVEDGQRGIHAVAFLHLQAANAIVFTAKAAWKDASVFAAEGEEISDGRVIVDGRVYSSNTQSHTEVYGAAALKKLSATEQDGVRQLIRDELLGQIAAEKVLQEAMSEPAPTAPGTVILGRADAEADEQAAKRRGQSAVEEPSMREGVSQVIFSNGKLAMHGGNNHAMMRGVKLISCALCDTATAYTVTIDVLTCPWAGVESFSDSLSRRTNIPTNYRIVSDGGRSWLLANGVVRSTGPRVLSNHSVTINNVVLFGELIPAKEAVTTTPAVAHPTIADVAKLAHAIVYNRESAPVAAPAAVGDMEELLELIKGLPYQLTATELMTLNGIEARYCNAKNDAAEDFPPEDIPCDTKS